MSIVELPISRSKRGCLDEGWVLVLLERFFKPGQRILDPFAGVDPVIARVGKRLGIEVVCSDILDGTDARNLPYQNAVFDGAFGHPPYWKALKYCDDPRALENCPSYECYIDCMQNIMSELKRVCKPKSMIIIVVGDYREKGQLYPIHADVIAKARNLGIKLYDI